VLRLQQIATGGSSVPRRGGQPSIRGTEASTQAVIRGVYNQILGNTGYAGERNRVEEIKLENGDISLREFIRQVARSNAFRRRYWSGLYICKAIEVMHRRILGRPTFGRWEIDHYFGIAARSGFYGVVDAMIDSPEYNETFGEDTVPYERFITPTDLTTRRVPALRRPFEPGAYADLTPSRRPQVTPPQQLRTVTGDPVRRNLPAPPPPVRGGWSAAISGGGSFSAAVSAAPVRGPETVRQAPSPQRTWRPSTAAAAGVVWTSTTAATPTRTATALIAPISGSWRSSVSSGGLAAPAEAAGAAMVKALRPGSPQGFRRRQSLGSPLKLALSPSRAEVDAVIAATYRQLLNREPLAAERLGDSESQLRDGQLSVAEFVALVAGSDLFQNRLNRLAPLRGAAAAHLALLGRASTPAETSRYLATRVRRGQRAAIQQILDSPDYAMAFGRDTVPYLRGLQTANGIPLVTVNRTASLYGGNAALNPAIKGAI